MQCRLRRKHTRKLFGFQHTFFFNFSSIKPDFKNHTAWAVVARRENASVSDKQEHTISEATQTYSNSTLYILKQTAFSSGVFQVPSERQTRWRHTAFLISKRFECTLQSLYRVPLPKATMTLKKKKHTTL